MSRLPFHSARAVASCPAVAGFRPASAALAVAAAFALQPLAGQAQPTGAQVIHGNASIATSGKNVTVTTQNGAGTNHSAINWQSFSVPAGSTTRFNQPSVTSTSINRVLGNNPSDIFGTLSSNGRLVLVNPAGIAVGAGAVVNTAGFTASTLGMSDMDALAGRLRFGGGAGGPLTVDGKIVTTSGDVVLIAPKLETGGSAVIESGGATILAAGQKVELTGRGLEGIVMEVQAGNEALNLGQIKGDAVGVFAGTLKHSGLITAQSASTDGGKVVLKATGGDALVSGKIVASAGDKGGSIDVLGERVGLLAGAHLQASGPAGGGSVRVGGDYQGKNAAVPNAKRVYIDRDARIEADATVHGNGGRVIVWSDDFTRMNGRISARGGPQGGDGGFAEVSGKQSLVYTGRTDLRAPKGKAGTLLLDPNNITIVHSEEPEGSNTSNQGSEFSGGPDEATVTDYDLNQQLAEANVLVTTSSSGAGGGNITLSAGALVSWEQPHALTLHADKGISMLGTIDATSPESMLFLEAMDGNVTGNGVIRVGSLYVTANGQSIEPTGGKVQLTGANLVGTLAGNAQGHGAEFVFNNAQSLTVGTVSESAGIQVSDTSGTAGQVQLTTSAGNLAVDASINGRSADLRTGNGNVVGAGAITAGSLYVAANGDSLEPTGGKVQLTGANQVGTLAGKATGNGAEFVFNNAQALAIGTVPGGTGIQVSDTSSTGPGLVQITAAGHLTVGAVIEGRSAILTATNGNVAGAGVIKVGSLYVSANGATFGPGTGGKVQLTGLNEVGTLAGDAQGYGAEFVFNNAQALTIGTVSDNSGIQVYDYSGSAGQAAITTAGSLTVAPHSDINARSVTLTANGGSSDIKIDYANIHATSGGVTLDADHDVLINDSPGSSAFAEIRGETFVSINAGNDIRIGTIQPGDGSATTNIVSNGGVDIIAANNVTMSHHGEVGTVGPSLVNVSAGPGGGALGVRIRANGGDVDFGGADVVEMDHGTTVRGNDAPVSVFAQGSIRGGGIFETNGGQDFDDPRGSVTLTAATGSVAFDRIAAGSAGSPFGGNVTIEAKTGITGQTIDANGGSYGSSSSLGAGSGGTVSLHTTGGNIVMGAIEASGTSYGSAGGGAGGKVFVIADTGNIEFAVGIFANGGTANAGEGGTTGGAGGKVTATAGGSVSMEIIQAIGGEGAPGGRGGEVNVTAGQDVGIGSIEVDGGVGAFNLGATGGAGGDVFVNFGRALSANIFAVGGQGSSSEDAHAGKGGQGGNIHVKYTGTGPFILGREGVLLDASGGFGGNATFFDSEGGPPASPWLGGAGGDGGGVFLAALNGEITLQSPLVFAGGGLGGSNSQSTSAPTPGFGAAGGMGKFGASASAVNVDGNFELDAAWTNETVVNIGGGSGVTGQGAISNKGTFNLSGTASVVVDGGVVNESAGVMKVSGSGSAVTVDLRTNAGTVEVGAGARLDTPFFDVNTGTVAVDGTLAINPLCETCESSGPIGEDSWEFVNQGTLSGNGTVVVAGGTGVVRNAAGGVIAPGGGGAVGTLTLQSTLVMDSGSTVQVEIGPSSTVDLLRANHVVAGGALDVVALSNASWEAGTLFAILQANSLDATALPTVDPERFELLASNADLKMVSKQQFPAPPPSSAPPAPVPSFFPPTGEVQQVQNEVVTFASLFIQESERQAMEERRRNQIGKDDIVVTDTACTP